MFHIDEINETSEPTPEPGVAAVTTLVVLVLALVTGLYLAWW
jgi:hypothetical protein